LLNGSKPPPKILILERGSLLTHSEQLERSLNTQVEPRSVIDIPRGHKTWNFTIGVGGGTVCWWGQTPRMHPSDFELFSKYGVGKDWPVTYAELEPYYCDAEDIIGVSGDSDRVGPFWRSRPYPLPAHFPSSADARMRELHAEQIALPNARVSVPDGPRPQCCAIGRCNLCPNDAKFTAFNGLASVLDHPSVTIVPGADVKVLSTKAGDIEAAVCVLAGKQHSVGGDLFVLGANSIFNAAILMRSGITHDVLGKGINEQVGYQVEIHLASLSGVDGGTSATGLFCGFLDGDHRRVHGATNITFDNRWKFFGLRKEFDNLIGKLMLIINAEDMPHTANYVEAPKEWDRNPVVHHARHSAYAEQGAQSTISRLPKLLEPLGVEDISEPELRPTESHIQGTTPMGKDPAAAVVDGNLIHHQYRNLAVVGTSVFPTCPVANPSLTAAALSLRASTRLIA
jgi:choline dehydrogenase-like flavoprotein